MANMKVWRSMEDVMAGATAPNQLLTILTTIIVFMLMIAIATRLSFPYRVEYAVYSSVALHVAGTVIVFLSTLAGFGVIAMLGVAYTPITFNAVPFLAVGLGLDDVLIMVHILKRLDQHQEDPLARMREALAHAGPSVLLTTVVNLGVFAISSFNPITIVRGFCFQMSVTIFVNKLLLLCMFVPCMFWDSMRVRARRTDLLVPPFILVTKRPKEEARFHAKGRVIEAFVDSVLVPAVSKPAFQAVVLGGFGAFFGLMAWSSLRVVGVGLSSMDLTLKGSYQESFLQRKDVAFSQEEVLLVTRQLSGDGPIDPQTQQLLMDTQTALQELDCTPAAPSIRERSWFAKMQAFANGTATSSQLIDASSPYLQDKVTVSPFFTVQSGYTLSKATTDLNFLVCLQFEESSLVPCCDDFSTLGPRGPDLFWATSPWGAIAGSIQLVVLEGVPLSALDQVLDAMSKTREAVALHSGGSSYMYGFLFAMNEQYNHMWSALFTLNGLSICVVVLLVLALEGSVFNALCQGVLALMINVEVMGLMGLMGLKLNAFSLANLGVAVGLGVEFTAHISYAFMLAQGRKRDRITLALKKMVPPVVHGAMSSFVPLCVTAFNPYPFVRQYFFRMFAITVWVAFVNSVVLLPVILWVWGPKPVAAFEIVRGQRRAVTHSPLEIGYKAPPYATRRRKATQAQAKGLESASRVNPRQVADVGVQAG